MPTRFGWLAQYDGPNPLAGEPIVVGSLTGATAPDRESVRRACLSLAPAGVGIGPRAATCLAETSHSADDGLLYLGQVASACSVDLLNEVRGFLEAGGATRTTTGVLVWTGFHHAPLAREVLQRVLEALLDALEGAPIAPKASTRFEALRQACRQHHPDYQARILMIGARDMGVPVLHFLPGSRYWQFGWGKRSRVFFESSSNEDGLLGGQWQRDKALAKSLMSSLGLPIAPHVLASSADELPAAIDQIGYPLVIKPLTGGGGGGVTANIRDPAQARPAFERAQGQPGAPVMIERHVAGHDHRLVVIDGKLVAAIRREPSLVTGNGHSTVAALVAELNAGRSKNLVESRYLRPIALDDILQSHLASQSTSLDDVPPPGRRITLRSNANLSTGGFCTDVTGTVHPQVRAMAEQLATTFGLTTAGLDYLTEDISRPAPQAGGIFIELNTTPSLDVCVAAGWSEARIARMVLGERVGAIPVELIVLAPQAMQRQYAEIDSVPMADDEALVCADRLRVGAAVLRETSATPRAAVHAALRNRRVAHLRILCTAADIQRQGLPTSHLHRFSIQDRLPEAWRKRLELIGQPFN